MNLQLSTYDRERFSQLRSVMDDNERLLRLYAAYLRECPRLIDGEMMARMRQGGALSDTEAFCALLGAACGLEMEESADDRRFARSYLYPSVRALSVKDYESNAYYQNMRVPAREFAGWMLRRQSYRPYEAFIYRDPVIDRHFRELPQLGFFAEEFSYPAVLEDGVEWMTVTPNEIASMEAVLAEAKGNVVTFGLGLGYFAYMASRKSEVSQVTVVERDPRVIRLFTEHLLPQFPHREKISVVCSDALLYARSDAMKDHSFLFADLWHDVSDGLPLYLKLKQLEKCSPWMSHRYWIESSLLSQLRRSVFSEICHYAEHPDPEGQRVEGFEAVCRLLSDSYLKELAAKLRPSAQ